MAAILTKDEGRRQKDDLALARERIAGSVF